MKPDTAKDIAVNLAVAFVVLGITALASKIWSPLSGRLAVYHLPTLLITAAAFVLFFVYDVINSAEGNRRWAVFLLYGLIWLLFLLLTTVMPEPWLQGHVPLIVSFAGLALGKLSDLRGLTVSYLQAQSIDRGTGFATTGVLIVETAEPEFILVFNENLRGGRGLWVPPGGHFRPARDDPDQRLIQKLETEIGMRCEVTHTHRYCVPDRAGDLRTESADWIEPPAFVLRENMFGECSEGHSTHIDMVYLCRTDGTTSGHAAKYDVSRQIRVPVRACLPSVEESERNIRQRIERWQRESTGVVAGIHGDLTRDVSWRLHLGAKHYFASQPPNEGSGRAQEVSS